MLTIWTDQGRLILTSSVGIFVGNEGDVDVTHQLDFDVGFNMAPDYAGAGFTTEMTDLSKAARTRQPAPMNLMEAIQLERLLFKIYEVSHEVHPFTQGQCADARFLSQSLRLSGAVSRPEDTPPSVRRVLDVRDLAATQVHAYLGAEDGRSGWDEFLLTPAQMRGIPTPWGAGERLRVTVPNFLNQSRLLAAGRYGEVLKQMGLSGGMLAARAATPVLLRDRAATFWVAAMGLLGAGLQAVPVDFQGTLLLHTYLTDFALSLTRLDMLQKMLATCRSIRPRARLGFHTNMAAEALQALRLLDVPVNEVSILTSPSAPEMAATLAALRRAGAPGALRLTAEVGPAPAVVHRVAYATPHRWAHGADAVLIGIGADQALARQRQQEVEQAWARVFPGLSMPEGVL
jgi:hypothetical protein